MGSLGSGHNGVVGHAGLTIASHIASNSNIFQRTVARAYVSLVFQFQFLMPKILLWLFVGSDKAKSFDDLKMGGFFCSLRGFRD